MAIYQRYTELVAEIDRIKKKEHALNQELQNIAQKAQQDKANEKSIQDRAYANYKALSDKLNSYLNQIPTDASRPKNLVEGTEQAIDERKLTEIAINADCSTGMTRENLYRNLYSMTTGMLKRAKREYEQNKGYSSGVDHQALYADKKRKNENEIDREYRNFLRGSVLNKFIRECREVRSSNSYISNRGYVLDIPNKYANEFKTIVEDKYDLDNKKVWLPFSIPENDTFIHRLGHESNQATADLTVTNFILGFLYSNSNIGCKILYIDAARMSSVGLGIFETMMNRPNSPIKRVPGKQEDIMRALNSVWNYGHNEVEPKLLSTGCTSLFDYNRRYPQKALQPQLLIINAFPYAYSSEIALIQQIASSSKKYGISMVLITDKNMLSESYGNSTIDVSLKNCGMLKINCDAVDYRRRTTPAYLSPEFIASFCPEPKLPEMKSEQRFNYYLTYQDSKVAKEVMQKIIWRYMKQNQKLGYYIQYINGYDFLANRLGNFESLVYLPTTPFRKVPTDQDKLTDCLKHIAYRYQSEVDAGLSQKGVTNIYEYNQKSQDKKNKPLLLILDNCKYSELKNNIHLRQLINRGKNWGISIVFMDGSDQRVDEKDDLFTLLKQNDLFKNVCDAPNFIDEKLPVVDQAFKDTYCPQPVKDLNLLSYYTWNPMDKLSSYERYIMHNGKKERKPLRVATYLSEYNKMKCFEYEYYDKFDKLADGSGFAGYLEGSSGCGKTTLIHTLIAGIVTQFHPDDVELWMADFKGVDFPLYIEHMPPHIKYLILDKSEQIICDFLDRISEELVNRMKVLSNHKCQNIFQLDPEIRLPRIMIIIDEFEEMIKVLNNQDSTQDLTGYKEKLKTLLARGRAYGMRVLLASQNYSKADTFFAESANNIPMRVAMMNKDNNEMMTILAPEFQVEDYRYERLKTQTSTLPPYESIIGLVDQNTGKISSYEHVQNLYIPDFDKPDCRFFKYIDKANQFFIAVEPQKFDKNNNRHYVDKHPQVLNGRQLCSYKDKKDEIELIRQRNDACQDEENVALFLGVSQTMESLKPVIVERAKYNNMLLVGGSSNVACMASITVSILNEFHDKGYEILFLPNKKSKLYKEYASTRWNRMGAMTDYLEMNQKLNQIIEDIKKQVKRKVLLVLCDTRSLAEEITDAVEELKEDMEYSEQTAEAVEEPVDSKEAFGDDDGIMANMPPEIAALYKDVMDDDVFSQTAEPFNITVSDLDDMTIWEKISFILDRGPRRGYHVFNICCDPKDASTSGDTLQAFNQNYYSHILSFKIDSNTAFNELGGALTAAAHIGEGEEVADTSICMYSGSDEKYTFRPFLYKGISWDDQWSVDENGHAQQLI